MEKELVYASIGAMIASTMQSLGERREIPGEVLLDELRAIREYVEEIPGIKRRLGELETKIDKINDRTRVTESITRAHEAELKTIKQHVALP